MYPFFKYLNPLVDYFYEYVNYYRDVYKLITLRDIFVLGELTDRAFASPNGFVKLDVKINDASAREHFAKVEKLIGVQSIVSQTNLAAQKERKPFKQAINAEDVLKFSVHALNAAFINWDHKQSLHEQLSYVAMQMVGKIFINVHDIPKTLVPLVQRAENAFINFDQMATKELEQINKELQGYSKILVEKNHQKIIQDNPYAVRYLGSSEAEKLIGLNPAAGLIVSGNVTTLLTGAIIKLVQRKDIFDKIKEEAASLDFSDHNEIDLRRLKSLPYLNLFYLECLRYFSPNPPFPRTVSKTGILADIPIYARTELLVPVRAILHHPNLWENPAQFNPERFSTHQYSQGSFPFIPFSTGPRMCPASTDFVPVFIKMAAVLLTKNYACSIDLPCEEISVNTKQPRFKQNYFMTLKPIISQTPEAIIFSEHQKHASDFANVVQLRKKHEPVTQQLSTKLALK